MATLHLLREQTIIQMIYQTSVMTVLLLHVMPIISCFFAVKQSKVTLKNRYTFSTYVLIYILFTYKKIVFLYCLGRQALLFVFYYLIINW